MCMYPVPWELKAEINLFLPKLLLSRVFYHTDRNESDPRSPLRVSGQGASWVWKIPLLSSIYYIYGILPGV